MSVAYNNIGILPEKTALMHVVTVNTASMRVDSGVITNRSSIEVHSRSSNSGKVYVGFHDALTAISGSRELSAGDSISFDVSEDKIVYGIASANGQLISVFEIGD